MDDWKDRKKGLVSVVITTYNYEQYICEALDGIKNQTYPHIEVIVMDDCSTDKTEEVVKYWREKNGDRFENFMYLKLPRNCSSAWCLNIGFQIASGEYIVIHDSDDISHPNKIEKQVKHLVENPNISAVGTKFQVFIDTTEKMRWPAAWLRYGVEEIQSNYLKDPIKHCVSFGTLLFRANIIGKLIGCKRVLGVANDINFVRDIVRNNFVLDNLNEILFYVRIYSKRLNKIYKIGRYEHNKKQREKINYRVSVILPISDNPKDVLRALKSIVNQNYRNIEIIIVDDMYQNDTKSIIMKWYKRYKKLHKVAKIKDIIYFKLPASVEYSWKYNIGAYLSKGEYIVFHGANGVSKKNKIKEQVKFLKHNPEYSIVGTNFNGHIPKIKFGDEIQYEYTVNETHCVNINTIMIDAHIIDEALGLGKENEGNEDFEFIYRLLYNGYKIENLQEVLYYE